MAVNTAAQGSSHVLKVCLICRDDVSEGPQGAAWRVRKRIQFSVDPTENSITPAFQSGLIRLV